MRLLYVEDDEDNRDVMTAYLDASGFDVSVAGTAAEAAALLAGARFDVVLLDMSLPDRDGGWVAKTAREAAPGVPVVMLTGWGLAVDPRVRRHVDLVVTKPVVPAGLIERLRILVRRRRGEGA